MKRLSLPANSLYAVDGANIARAEVATALVQDFDRIMNEYGQALSRLAASYEPVPSQREDLLQEIVLAIWRALPRFRGECSERTFIYRIAHNRGLSYAWHRHPIHQPLDELEAVDEPVDPRPHPEEQTAQRHQKKQLLDAVQTLPMAYRQIVMLLLEDLSQAEIAEVLGITENNVAVRLNRARKALKQALGVAS
jgi:RNA polymerase sigma-70 factor (ECF subfamily)